MTFDLLSLLGVEGIAIFSLIVAVSVGLAGFRFSMAGTIGQVADDTPGRGRIAMRQRLANRLQRPMQNPAKQSWPRDAARIAGWVFAATRDETAKDGANQSGFTRHRVGVGRVKAVSAVAPRQRGADPAAADDHRACVASDEPKRMDSETQWSRVNAIVNEGLAQAKEIEELHAAAARQLDAVDYAYERMLLELREVLPEVAKARTVCRTNRDEAYAEASSAALASADGAGGVQVDEVALKPAKISSPCTPTAPGPREKARKPETAESVAA